MNNLELKTPSDPKRYYTNERMFVLQAALHLNTIDNLDVKAELKRLEKLASEVD